MELCPTTHLRPRLQSAWPLGLCNKAGPQHSTERGLHVPNTPTYLGAGRLRAWPGRGSASCLGQGDGVSRGESSWGWKVLGGETLSPEECIQRECRATEG